MNQKRIQDVNSFVLKAMMIILLEAFCFSIIIPFMSKKMAEEEGFEPPRGVNLLAVFKTAPFSQTWVLLRTMVDPAGLEPATDRL